MRPVIASLFILKVPQNLTDRGLKPAYDDHVRQHKALKLIGTASDEAGNSSGDHLQLLLQPTTTHFQLTLTV
jgi:hypothetical protein